MLNFRVCTPEELTKKISSNQQVIKRKTMKKFIWLLLTLPALVLASSSNQFNFLSISDVHLNAEQTHIMQINPTGYDAQNDMDYNSFNKLMIAIKNTRSSMSDKPYFIIYLGDMVGHNDSILDRSAYVKKNENVIFKRLLNDFPDTPIITIFGNNDSTQSDYGDFQNNNISPFTIAENAGFKNGFLSTGLICNNEKSSDKFPCLLKQFRKNGYFSILLKKNLMLIGLNSVMFSPNHQRNTAEFEKQFEFLESELQLAQSEKIKVIIATHIPVGDNVYDGSAFWKDSPRNTFLDIISKYRQEIVGLLAGHTHMEEFKIIQFPDGERLGQYLTAGLSTSHGNSPSFKTFSMKIENNEWIIENYTTYQIHDNKLSFSKYYDFFYTYCQNSNHTKNINDCLYSINFDDILPQYTVNNPNYSNYSAQDPSVFFVKVKS